MLWFKLKQVNKRGDKKDKWWIWVDVLEHNAAKHIMISNSYVKMIF